MEHLAALWCLNSAVKIRQICSQEIGLHKPPAKATASVLPLLATNTHTPQARACSGSLTVLWRARLPATMPPWCSFRRPICCMRGLLGPLRHRAISAVAFTKSAPWPGKSYSPQVCLDSMSKCWTAIHSERSSFMTRGKVWGTMHLLILIMTLSECSHNQC